MRFTALTTGLTAMFLALPAAAFDIDAMTEAERQAFREEIRGYLLDNPEVLMEALGVLEARREAEAAANEGQLLVEYEGAIFDDGWSYVGGNPDGDVTIVEFLDYRCGFCKRAFPAVEELVSTDGNIKLIIKEFPILGPASELGSRYAIAAKRVAGDGAYKSVHDAMMSMRGDLSEAVLAKLSDDLVLDHDAITAEMQSDEVSMVISTNRELASRLEIQGTPSFIMGDQFVRGFVELEQMRDIVEAIRAEKG